VYLFWEITESRGVNFVPRALCLHPSFLKGKREDPGNEVEEGY